MAFRWIIQNHHTQLRTFHYGKEDGIAYSGFVNKILKIHGYLRLGRFVKKAMRPSYFIFSQNMHYIIQNSLFRKWYW
jgi:hypothetical protein